MLEKLVLICEAILDPDGDTHYCGRRAKWIARWSDREMVVCEEHKQEAQNAYDGDHEYDQTGLEWIEVVY